MVVGSNNAFVSLVHQAKAATLQSCFIVIRILRDLCRRVPAWAAFNSWVSDELIKRIFFVLSLSALDYTFKITRSTVMIVFVYVLGVGIVMRKGIVVVQYNAVAR